MADPDNCYIRLIDCSTRHVSSVTAIPCALARDAAGTIFVANAADDCVERVALTGQMQWHLHTLAGHTPHAGDDDMVLTVDGTGGQAKFTHPRGLAADSAGSLYVAQYRALRRVRVTDGEVSSLRAAADEAAERWEFAQSDPDPPKPLYAADPNAVTLSRDGRCLYWTDDSCIRQWDSQSRAVSVFAGHTTEQGFTDGPAAQARFACPRGMCFDEQRRLFVCDMNNNRLRCVLPEGHVLTIAGTGRAGYAEGDGEHAQFHSPYAVCVDPTDECALLVADMNNHCIRHVLLPGLSRAARAAFLMALLPRACAGYQSPVWRV